MSSQHKTLKKWLVIAAKLLILGLVVWGVHATLDGALQELDEYRWSVKPWWLVASGAIYLVGMIPAAVFWHRILVSAGQDVRLGETVRTHFISQLGKYAPGKALVLVLRAGLLRRPTVETTVVTASVFYETFSTMAAGSLVAVILLAWRADIPPIPLPLWKNYTVNVEVSYFAVALTLALGIPTIPPVFRRIVMLLGVNKINPSAADKFGNMPYRTLAAGWCLVAVGWGVQGLSLGATLQALGADGDLVTEWPRNTAAVCLSVVAGFLTLIPGGLGVREGVLIAILASRYNNSMALVSAIILRLVWLVSEAIVSAILYVVGGKRLPLTAIWKASRKGDEELIA